MAPQSEDGFLSLIDRYFPNASGDMIVGRGDDCAVMAVPGRICVTTDLFLEDVHFRRTYFGPGDVGHKSLAVNISDIAAMGGRPLGFSVGLTVPTGLDDEYWEAFMQGMADLAARHELVLTGGDLSRGESLGVCVTVWGEVTKRPMLRRTAQVGDLLFALGDLGKARAGLMLLEAGDDLGLYPECVKAHLRPEPLVSEGRRLAEMAGVRGLMDISDGIARDLPRYLGSLGAELILSMDDVHPEVIGFCAENGFDPLEFALKGGEDYGLLGAVAPEGVGELQETFPKVLILGRVREASGYVLNGADWRPVGFDHFS